MATDYGGTYGSQPLDRTQPAQSAQPPLSGPELSGPGWTPGTAAPPVSRPPARPRARLAAFVALVVGAALFLGSLAGIAGQLLPRRFTAAQQQQITSWEYGQRWRTLTAGAIFPASVGYAPPASLSDDPSLMLAAHRIGIARAASCKGAADSTAARVLGRGGCTALLRATYVDGTDSYVVTVGVAVLAGTGQAAAAEQAISAEPGTGGLSSTVHTAPFAGTPAADFTSRRRQLSGVTSAGSYVVLWTAGYADDRPREPVARNKYTAAEMSSAGAGAAHAVLSALAAPVPPARCPGVPGC